MAPTSHSHIGRELYAPAAWRESSLEGGKNMLSISQNNICLPASPFKTINKIRGAHNGNSPLSPLSSLSVSFPTLLYSLPFCSSSFASTMQTFRGLSAPPLLGELQHKTSLCGQVSSGTRRGEARIDKHPGA